MRLLITNVLAMALLLFGVASANAFSTSMSSNYGGSDLGNGDTVTVTVDFDSGGVADIQVLSVSVLLMTQWLPMTQVPARARRMRFTTPGAEAT